MRYTICKMFLLYFPKKQDMRLFIYNLFGICVTTTILFFLEKFFSFGLNSIVLMILQIGTGVFIGRFFYAYFHRVIVNRESVQFHESAVNFSFQLGFSEHYYVTATYYANNSQLSSEEFSQIIYSYGDRQKFEMLVQKRALDTIVIVRDGIKLSLLYPTIVT